MTSQDAFLDKHGGKERRNVFVLSASFTAIFTAYLAIQNLQSSLNQADGLGIISLSCMYACIILSGILAPSIIGFLGEKTVIVVSFICHVVYTCTNFYPTFATLIPSSVLLGLTAGPMWTSQSVYLSDMAYSYAGRKNSDSHTILSKYNGIFFAMYETTQITGNLISSIVLQQGTYNYTNTNETVKFCGRYGCPKEVNALIALLFADKKDAAFANYHTWKAIGFTVTFVYSNFLCVSTKLVVAIGLLVAAMLLYAIVEFRVRSRNERTYRI
ncbi:UN93A-like protein [Mya arenaria]|uniref:UN93A-like protein n=1 Tax=Mya arenaria TaxID=6604 RepID=A0ABY7E0E8_MYAAR|nr:UN93A-like protein [Mya arenaria]